MKRFSKKAKTHAAQSRIRTKRMLSGASGRGGPVTISYLPGFEPPAPKSKFPFYATINGKRVVVESLDVIRDA